MKISWLRIIGDLWTELNTYQLIVVVLCILALQSLQIVRWWKWDDVPDDVFGTNMSFMYFLKTKKQWMNIFSGTERAHCSCHRSEIWRKFTVFGFCQLWQNPQGLRKLLSCIICWTDLLDLPFCSCEPNAYYLDWTHSWKLSSNIHSSEVWSEIHTLNIYWNSHGESPACIFIVSVSPTKNQWMYCDVVCEFFCPLFWTSSSYT